MADAEADGGPLMRKQAQGRTAVADAKVDGSCRSKGKRQGPGPCKSKRTGDALAGARSKASAVAKCLSWEWGSRKVGARVVEEAPSVIDVFSVLC